TKHKVGEKVRFSVIPAAKAAAAEKRHEQPTGAHEVTVTTARSGKDQGPSRPIVGITAGVDHTFPFSIDIKLADVGGPSAGLMFALGLVD
ncbi:PDZ/DHR/GLGF domain-containing protein, partial [Streptomyces sp. SID11233]|nr:PDZ/DHR/GLGF domain-containing protein [Streptomyces sp. SID11233]